MRIAYFFYGFYVHMTEDGLITGRNMEHICKGDQLNYNANLSLNVVCSKQTRHTETVCASNDAMKCAVRLF